MPTNLRFKRSTGSTPPASLEFGEPAFTDENNTLHIGKSNGSEVALPIYSPYAWPPLILEGLQLTRDSGTQLTVSKGNVTVLSTGGERALIRQAADLQKTLSGGELADGWHHVFSTWNPSNGAIDWTTDTDPDGANLSISLSRRWIGAYLVESGAIADFYCDGEWFVWKPQRISFNGAIATTATAYALSVPTGFRCHVQLAGHPGHAASTETILIEVADGDGELPAALGLPWENNAACFLMSSFPTAEIREFNSAFRWQTTDSSAQILAIRSGNYVDTNSQTTLTTLRWKRAS